MIRKVLLLSMLSLLSTSLIALENSVSKEDLLGVWGRDNCSGYVHTTELTENGEYFRFTDSGRSYYYYIAGKDPRGLKLVMLGESRLDDEGNPATWYVVMDGKDRFYWLRADRDDNDLRGPLERCEQQD